MPHDVEQQPYDDPDSHGEVDDDGRAVQAARAQGAVAVGARSTHIAFVAYTARGARDCQRAVVFYIRWRRLARLRVVALPKERFLRTARLDGARERNGRHPVTWEYHEEADNAPRSLRLGGALDTGRVDERREVARLGALRSVLAVRLHLKERVP